MFIYYLLQAKVVTYQCSPKTTDKDIVDVFKEAKLMRDTHEDSDSFVSVVCLDELGLAEGSMDNPLKVSWIYSVNHN